MEAMQVDIIKLDNPRPKPDLSQSPPRASASRPVQRVGRPCWGLSWHWDALSVQCPKPSRPKIALPRCPPSPGHPCCLPKCAKGSHCSADSQTRPAVPSDFSSPLTSRASGLPSPADLPGTFYLLPLSPVLHPHCLHPHLVPSPVPFTVAVILTTVPACFPALLLHPRCC